MGNNFNKRKKHTVSKQQNQPSVLIDSLKNLTVAEFAAKASKFKKNIFKKKFNKNNKHSYQNRGKDALKKKIKFLRKKNSFIKLNFTFPHRWFILLKFFYMKRLLKRPGRLKRLGLFERLKQLNNRRFKKPKQLKRFRRLLKRVRRFRKRLKRFRRLLKRFRRLGYWTRPKQLKRFKHLRLRFFLLIARLRRKLFQRIKSNRRFFFNKYKCLVSLNYPSVVWVRRRRKFSFFRTVFLKKKYSLSKIKDGQKRGDNRFLSKYQRKRKRLVFKKVQRRLKAIRRLFNFYCKYANKGQLLLRKRKFVSFFKLRLEKYKKLRLLYNFLYFLNTRNFRIKNLKLLLLRFFFVKFSYRKKTNKFFKTFVTCLRRPLLFRYRQKLAKATRRYRTRHLRRRTKSRLGLYSSFRVSQRFLSRFPFFSKWVATPRTKRVWVKNRKYYKGRCVSKGYWTDFQPPDVLKAGFRFRWLLLRPIKKVQFLRDFSRRRWQSFIWLWRSKENRRRLRGVFKFLRFGLNHTSFSRFYSQYFNKKSVFSTMLFSFYKENYCVSNVFEFDVYKYFVFNFLSLSSVSSKVFEELNIIPKAAFSLLSVPRNRLLSIANQNKKPVSFLVVYLMYKKQKSISALFSGLTSLRLQTKKRRIALLRRDSFFVKARKEITLRKDKKSWFSFIKWRNWKRRFSPLLFKTVSIVKNLSIYNYILLLSKQLKIFSSSALQFGGFFKNFSVAPAKSKGFSFIKRWFYRNLGKRLKLPFQKRTYKKFKKIFLRRQFLYKLKKLKFKHTRRLQKNKCKVLKVKSRSKKFTDSFKNKQKHYPPTFEARFAGYKKKNLLYKLFSTRFAVGLFKMRRVVWSESDLKNVSRKYKHRLYKRILQKVPVHERVYFRPWSLRWWDFYNKRFIRARNDFIAGLITSLGIVVKVTLNNVFVGVVDDAGSPFTAWSAGSVGFKGPTKKTTTAVDLLLEEVFGFAQKIGFDSFKVAFASSPTSFLAKRFLGSFVRPHLSVQSVSFCGKLPHNGVRARRQKRR